MTISAQLRDVTQTDPGTILFLEPILSEKITSRTTGAKGCKFDQFDLYWPIFFIYLGPSCLSESILVCLDLSWFISVYLGPAGFTFLYLFWSISGYIELSKAILDENWISRAILGYPGFLGLYLYIMSYLSYCFENQFWTPC